MTTTLGKPALEIKPPQGPDRDVLEPFAAVSRQQGRFAVLQSLAVRVAGGQPGQFHLGTDEFAPLGLPLLLEPVRIDEAWDVVLGSFADGSEQPQFQGRGWFLACGHVTPVWVSGVAFCARCSRGIEREKDTCITLTTPAQ